MALNKVDRLDVEDRAALARLAAERGWAAVLVSAARGDGIDELREALVRVASSPAM
jgi:50S ribosomal subunit-associated GTPase HflX